MDIDYRHKGLLGNRPVDDTKNKTDRLEKSNSVLKDILKREGIEIESPIRKERNGKNEK